MNREKPIGFNRRDAGMLIRNAEASSRFPDKSQIDHSDGPRLALIYSSGGCTARSGTTLGTGTGVVQKIDPSTAW